MSIGVPSSSESSSSEVPVSIDALFALGLCTPSPSLIITLPLAILNGALDPLIWSKTNFLIMIFLAVLYPAPSGMKKALLVSSNAA